MAWSLAIEALRPHVVKISTPSGYGTGFLSLYNANKSWLGIATAAHVVSYADEWGLPIKLYHPESDTNETIQQSERVIFIDHVTDSAVVLLPVNHLKLPAKPIDLLPLTEPCGLGVEVGWLGFPNVEPNTLCFFSGAVSARLEHSRAYLIDGVAINGVSGGPVFHTSHSGQLQIIGCVSAYHPNRATGEALPGLLRAQDVSHFHDVVVRMKNIEEGQKKKREFEADQKGSAQSVTVGPGPSAGTAPKVVG